VHRRLGKFTLGLPAVKADEDLDRIACSELQWGISLLAARTISVGNLDEASILASREDLKHAPR
jgi:hypothetical protein